MEKILTMRYASPLGEMIIGSYSGRLCLCDWVEGRRRRAIDRRLQAWLRAGFEAGASPVVECAAAQLDEYFAGGRREFDLPLVFAGSQFQRAVWEELLKIPYGATITYGEQAQRMGNPKAVRAVASANGVNALSVIVPCHRVVGSGGALTGYGGGLAAKEALLRLESAFRE